jgi:uncharacterized membrane protein YbhN (UPF0104 family)
LTSTSKKLLSYLFKAAILVLTIVFVYHQYIKKGADIKRFEALMHTIGHTQVLFVMLLVVGLMLINWLLEAMKWQYLIRNLEQITFWKAIECVFCGLTWAIFTPNRLGEYGGRVMFLSPRKRIHGVFAMAVGSFGQNVITNVLGSIAIMWFTIAYMHLNTWIVIAVWLLGILNITLFLVCFFNIKWLVLLLNKIPFLRKYHRFFDVIGRYKFDELHRIILFCLARFIAFSCQYYILINLFIPSIPVYEILLLTFIVFFIQSALPSLDLVDVAVRSATAATVFAYVTDQTIAVIAVFSAVWLINLIIPAILGIVFNLKLNFFGRNS